MPPRDRSTRALRARFTAPRLHPAPWLAALWLAACATHVGDVPDPDGLQLRNVIDGPQRSAADRARDAARHPFETLRFFGLRPDQTVIEIAPGGGWYTEILAPYLRDAGGYRAALYVEPAGDPAETNAELERARARFASRFGERPAIYGTVKVGALQPEGLQGLGAPGSADLVLTFRNIHNWIESGHLDSALHAFYLALKPGGSLGIEEHRAAPGTPEDRIIATGYVPEAYVIRHVEAAGFRLAARSEANANPRDTKDHANGVWSLPPTLRGGDTDRQKYLAIGESDRMTLRFTKPAVSPTGAN